MTEKDRNLSEEWGKVKREHRSNLDVARLKKAKMAYERARISGDEEALKKAIQAWEETEKTLEEKNGFSFLR